MAEPRRQNLRDPRGKELTLDFTKGQFWGAGENASTLTLMEDDPEFLEHVKAYFLANYQHLISEFIESKVEDKPSFVRSKEGNVITLDFNTKTHGNA